MFEEYFNRLIRIIGGQVLLDLKAAAELGERERITFLSVLERKLQALEGNYGEKAFTFRDVSQRTVLYQYILEFHIDEDFDGTPLIVLNDFPPFIKGDKQNPVLHLVLRYEDVDIRDEDYKLLLVCRK